MRRALALLLLALVIVPAATAQTAPPPRGTIWTVLTTVQATVDDGYATVKVIADIGNRGPDPEFPFQVRIPDDAFVTGLTIERDGTLYEATIKARDEARAEYEEWKAQQQTGGLVEKARRSSVYSYLINVAEFTSVRATLTYERYLAADRGVYNLSLEAPVSGFGEDQGARFDVLLRHRDGLASAWSLPGVTPIVENGAYHLSYAVGPRPTDASTPFDVSYTVKATGDGGSLVTTTRDGAGYFVHRFRAPAGERQMPVDLVLALDVSGSMSGLKMQQMKDAATQVLQQLNADDRLHLAFFSGDASSPWSGLRSMTPENRKAAAAEIDAALVAGGTNLEAALRRGFSALDGIDWREEEGRLPALVLLTDGQPTAGNTDRQALRDLARSANAHGVNVFAIAFGSDADWSFVHAIATDGNGTALRVPEGAGAEVDIRRFMESLTTPVLKDVRVVYPAGVTAYRSTAPILFAGSELLVVGTYDAGQGMPGATVRAMGPDGPVEYEVAASTSATPLPYLPRIVAYERIRQLQETIDAEGETPAWAGEIKELGLRHGFVTDYTSLVVTLEPRSPTAANTTMWMGDAQADTAMRVVPTTTAPSSSGGWWNGLMGGSAASSSAPAPTTATGSATPPPPAKVPGPELALVLGIMLVGAILIGRRKDA